MKKLVIDERIARDFPGIVLGVLCFRDISNAGEDPEIVARLREEEARILERYQGSVITEHPHIATWREAYRKFGAKPKDYPSSIENLLRRVLKGHALRPINRIVDLYNAISLRYVLPVGGEDLDQIKGDVLLTYATEQEQPVVLLGENEAKAPKPGEVIYKDENGAICRRWNWKEADRTKFTENTRNGFLVMESLPPVQRETVDQALGELADLVQRYCGGDRKSAILDETNREFLL